MKQQVLVIGLGLIGGSLSLSLQRNKEVVVIGHDYDIQTMRKAKKLGVIHEMALHPKEIVHEIDFIIFATPVNETLRMMDELKSWPIRKNTIITDTGSTKVQIMEKAESLRESRIHFIGGHPMAGSHKSGVEAAKEHLFENAYYMLTPLPDEDEEIITALELLVKPTKGKITRVTAEEHDQMTAVVSHFPHLVAASLVHQLEEKNKSVPFTKHLAAGGFRDITRIASSNPIMWRDITLQNREKLSNLLDSWLSEMNKLKQLLNDPNPEEIEQYFSTAKSFRDNLPSNQTGAIYAQYDLYVDLPDYPGVISEITKYLAEASISITNLRIVETRADVFGILVISFQSPEDRLKGEACIKANTTFETYIS